MTALLLDPSSQRFSGDVRILAKLVEKEDEAHTALGDAASLMGVHDVKGEEDEIRAVLAGAKEFDDVVRPVAAVAAGNDLAAMFAQLFDAPPAPATEPTPAAETREDDEGVDSGLYADDVTYLEDALREAFIEPTASPADGGVGWRRDPAFGIVELVPTPDLVQRLEVLPQSYLAGRRVTERLVLATTRARGKDRLAAALRDEGKLAWPDAHYLGPLHPVLDWAADRALAALGRNEVFAVRGAVDSPTVLLLGTLTNRRGQVVSAAWLTAEFPAPETPSFALMVPHASAREALHALGWNRVHDNPGPVADVDALRSLVAPAVHEAEKHLLTVFEAAEQDVARRIDEWSRRLDRWEEEADALIQRSDLRQRRISVAQERELVQAMAPDRQLVRPLLVVVPNGEGNGQ
jgi:hypothetical protein